MQITARNRLAGTITSIKLGGVMAEVVVQVGENEIVSVVTRTSVEELGIAEGDQITAIIKSTEVMLAR
jgi:molybdopterin-binding protein